MDAWNSTTSTRFCRRNLLFITVGGAAIGGAGGATAQSSATPSASLIEPATIKRRGVGLRGHDPDRAFAGFTLFSPLPSNNKTVYLIDMQGDVVHTWQMPYPPGQSGYLTDRGTLFYNGQIPNDSHVGRAPYRGGSALEMTWDGRILWEDGVADLADLYAWRVCIYRRHYRRSDPLERGGPPRSRRNPHPARRTHAQAA